MSTAARGGVSFLNWRSHAIDEDTDHLDGGVRRPLRLILGALDNVIVVTCRTVRPVDGRGGGVLGPVIHELNGSWTIPVWGPPVFGCPRPTPVTFGRSRSWRVSVTRMAMTALVLELSLVCHGMVGFGGACRGGFWRVLSRHAQQY
ncbi:MAG: hypothetical protein JO364_08325 [Pseudonocardiales bacterium]|nr:hypothetical protein [Pseudonocardiales bacterium]MBV9030304.1 hypothetical protein [Pseudonocardiales bacterium]